VAVTGGTGVTGDGALPPPPPPPQAINIRTNPKRTDDNKEDFFIAKKRMRKISRRIRKIICDSSLWGF
jgi:hypothetical protein